MLPTRLLTKSITIPIAILSPLPALGFAWEAARLANSTIQGPVLAPLA